MYMHIARTSWKSENGRVYEWVWLRQNRREGKAAKKRAIANLEGCTREDKRRSVETPAHQRYKDLAGMEQAFRTSKTVHLGMRPIFVRTEETTRGRVFVVMPAYLIRRLLSRAWAPLDTTVEEGLDRPKTLCSMEVKFRKGAVCLQIPGPRDDSLALAAVLKG